LIRFGPVLAWTALIFVLSSQTYATQSIQPVLHRYWSTDSLRSLVPDVTVHYDKAVIVAHEAPYRFAEFLFRKSAHLFVYAVLANLAYVAFRSSRLWRSGVLGSAVLAVGYCFAIACLDEWNQARFAQRTSTFTDVLLDTAGGVMGVVAMIAVVRLVVRGAGTRSRGRESGSCRNAGKK